MPLNQFLIIQAMLFGIYVIGINIIGLTGNTEGLLPTVLMNFLTFFPGAWLACVVIKKQPHLIINVLSATLSFNLATYLLVIALGAKLPAYLWIAGDFLMVSLFSLLGALAYIKLTLRHKDSS